MGRLSVARGGSLGCKAAPTVCGPPWRAVYSKVRQINNNGIVICFEAGAQANGHFALIERQRNTQKAQMFAEGAEKGK